MATIPVYNPVIPFLGLIPGGIRPGSKIRVKGILNNYEEWCQINIQTGAALKPQDDVVLHLSIRPNEPVIVRNTLLDQEWENEERWGGCPIVYGQPFDVLMVAEENQWRIAINGNHFCTFNHRYPLHTAQYVYISQGVIHSIITEMDSGAAPPYPGGPHPIAYMPQHVLPYGFGPVAPPMPPYTLSSVYRGGSGHHYQGGPTNPGYPHPTVYPAAVSYSPTKFVPAAVGVTSDPGQPQLTKRKRTGKFKKFLRYAVCGGCGSKSKPATETNNFNSPPVAAHICSCQIPAAYPRTATYGNIQHQPSAPTSSEAYT